MSYDFYIKKGDRLPALERTLLYDSGTAINLTAATVKFIFKKPGASSAVVGNATVEDATTGAVKYAWGATDSDTTGLMTGEWEITFPGGKMTVPNNRHLRILVFEDLGNAP
jgi:hypothetical protein